MSTPDGVTPVQGYRAWKAWPSGGPARPWMRSWFVAEWWPTDEAMVARCAPAGAFSDALRHPHVSPDWDCQCGFYAVNELAWLLRAGRQDPELYGRVEGWGKVILHEHGWRAQYARPTALFVFEGDSPAHETHVREVAKFYNVPVEVLERPATVPDEAAGQALTAMAASAKEAAAHFDSLVEQMKEVTAQAQRLAEKVEELKRYEAMSWWGRLRYHFKESSE